MKKNSIKRLAYFAFVVLAVFLASGCEQAPAPAALEKQSNEVGVNIAAAKSGAWPYIADQQKVSALAENLLAKNFVVILDGSGSMDASGCSGGERKIDVAKKAITDWSTTIPAGSNLGLVAFHNGWTTLDLLPKEQSKNFTTALDNVGARGNTPLATAIKLAYGMLTKQAQRQLGYGEYVIVVVTDGGDNDENESLEKWVGHVLGKTPIRLFTIGFCIDGDHYLNQRGRTIYKEANNPAELRKGLKEVLAEAESFDVKGFAK